MQGGVARAPARGGGWRCAGLCAAAALLALSVGGCQTTKSGSPTASAAPGTIAFESIDGPPPGVFQKLVQKLNDEAGKRQLPVASREGFAAYRVRGYLALGIEKKKKRATVSWVWDVYDAQEQRALRVSGAETVPLGADPWAGVDEAMLSRMAGRGMEQLAGYLRSAPPAASPEPAPAGPGDERVAVASARTDDFRPEAFGIFRLFTPAEAQAATREEPAGLSADVPLPRRRPARAGRERVALAPGS
jgi:hypothetical protein